MENEIVLHVFAWIGVWATFSVLDIVGAKIYRAVSKAAKRYWG